MSIPPVYLKRNQASLVLGGLNLTGTSTDAAGNVFFQIDAQDADTTWGAPIPVDVSVQRWMTDGAVASTQGHENREIFFKVVVSAATSAALEAGEAALAKLAGKPTTLTWTPPEGAVLASPTVFEVWTWHLEPEFDTSREMRLARMYGVRITAKPWARSLNLTSAAAITVPGSPTTVSIDTCASTTGWTGTPDPPTTSGGAVLESHTGGSGTRSLTRTGAVTGFGTTPYLMLDMKLTGPILSSSIVVQIDGVALSKVAQVGTLSYWQVVAPTTGFTVLKVTATFDVTHGGPIVLSIADVSRTDTIGGIGSRKQLSRTLAVGGSVKTSGSIQIASPSATALGNCLVYTCADDGSGYSPPLRQYRTSGGTVTVDATCVSGNHETFVSAGGSVATIVYTIPAAQLPEGTYVLLGRFLFGATASTMTVTTTAKASGYAVVQTVVGTVTNPTAVAATQWGILGVLSLPAQSMPPESQVATLVTVLATATASATVTLDELYLLDISHGDFSLVYTGLGGPAFTQLWLDAPDADPAKNRPAVYTGTLADRSDASFPAPNGLLNTQIKAIGDHDLDPDGAILFTVTDGVDNAVVTGSFYHRWHTHAGD